VNTPAAALAGLLAPLLAGRDAAWCRKPACRRWPIPGADLVRLAHQHGIPVRPLVGPSSLLLAVMASGLNGQSFAFNGYLPTDAAQRTKRIKELEQRSRKEKQTQLLIETPYRNAAMLEALANRVPAGHADLRGDRPQPAKRTIRTMSSCAIGRTDPGFRWWMA
jgi:16S rRNA (cytidine1402-2'-O)-methyltransferase